MPKNITERLYQLIVSRLDGEEIPKGPYRRRILRLVEAGVGGFIVFGGMADAVGPFIEEIQAASPSPLFIASDIERGVGQQIKGFTEFPPQMAQAAAIDRNRPEDVRLLRSAIAAIADEASCAGINMPLIPVLDVNRNPDNPIICTRAFSDDCETVPWFGAEYIAALESSGLISSAKHFPGHGDTSTDSHMALPVIGKSYDELMREDIAPFKEAIGKGVGSIMAGHLLVPALSDKPASMSERIITGLLRGELGFGGLVLTDALNMDALKGFGNVPAGCLNAGADILLHPSDPDETVRELLFALKSGIVKESRIDEALSRIARAKEKIRLRRRIEPDLQANRRLSSGITERSITLVKHTRGVLPLSGKVSVVLAGDRGIYEKSRFKSYFRDARNPETTVFAIFTAVSAWKGNSGISDVERQRVSALIRKSPMSVVVSFGSPYVLRCFNEADILIAAYGPDDEAQRAVIERLKGDAPFKGRLPVKIS
ncbi:MAG: glycoside hydrolase family 3 N-terminal domain-containing protein [Thermodesulfovibrionales bacterium]|nr:glycoside hydrolase family 3 N-terminal domain-containing protein [Thermodesulfovibrionales bacterium]